MKKLTIVMAILLLISFVAVGAQAAQLIPGGQLIGLELADRTVTVAAFEKPDSAARQAGMQVGDTITGIDGSTVECAADVRSLLARSRGTVTVELTRNGKAMTLTVAPAITRDGPRLGVYLKQGVTGVGTVTYYDPEDGSFGALGHCVNDSAGKLLDTTGGMAYDAGILQIRKGKVGKPGQLMGSMQVDRVVGDLTQNTKRGVFGKLTRPLSGQTLETACAEQVHTGDAKIRSTVGDQGVQEYSVKILKIYPSDRSGGRNMLVKITDKRLLDTTGGIVQGMSGSPIIQDGKLVGAVTHVLVNDPTTGYGIFIENMLDAAA